MKPEKKNKLFHFLLPTLLLGVSLAFIACGGDDGGVDQGTGDGDSSDEIRVAFVTNMVADFWNIAKAGCRDAEKELGVEVEVKMPNPGMTPAEADIIAAYLLASTIDESEKLGAADRVKFFLASQIPELRYRHLVLAFFLGGILAALGLIGLAFTLRKGPKT